MPRAMQAGMSSRSRKLIPPPPLETRLLGDRRLPGQRATRLRLEIRFGRPYPQATGNAVQEIATRLIAQGAAVELHSGAHRTHTLEDRTNSYAV